MLATTSRPRSGFRVFSTFGVVPRVGGRKIFRGRGGGGSVLVGPAPQAEPRAPLHTAQQAQPAVALCQQAPAISLCSAGGVDMMHAAVSGRCSSRATLKALALRRSGDVTKATTAVQWGSNASNTASSQVRLRCVGPCCVDVLAVG